jgi:hypothetical protein
METLQALEFIVSPEDAVLADRVQPAVFHANLNGAWSLVPASRSSEARLRRLAAAARVRMSLQLCDPASPVL